MLSKETAPEASSHLAFILISMSCYPHPYCALDSVLWKSAQHSESNVQIVEWMLGGRATNP